LSSFTRPIPFVLLLVAAAGCSSEKKPGDGQQPGAADHLREVAGMLRLHAGERGKGPRKAADLAPYEHGHPLGFQAVKSGEIVVVWGATMPGEGEAGGGEAVVAYEKKALAAGGAVLLQNGTVKTMTADELKAAPKGR
jgi:hypothetical protein